MTMRTSPYTSAAYTSAAATPEPSENLVQQLVSRARTWAGKPDNAAGLQSLSAVLSEATGLYGLLIRWNALSHSDAAGDLPIQQLGLQDPVSASLHADLCLLLPGC